MLERLGLRFGTRHRAACYGTGVGVALLLIALFVPLPASTAVRAASITVANGDVSGLISAINQTNAAGGSNTINLAAGGDYVLSNPDNGAPGTGNGLPVITNGNDLTINGNGASIRRLTTAVPFRILQVGTTLRLNDVTLRDGTLQGTTGGDGINGTAAQPDGGMGGTGGMAQGGAILNLGTLVITGSTLTANTVTGGTGGAGGPGVTGCGPCTAGNGGTGGTGGVAQGGAVFSLGSLTIVNSTITGNRVIGGTGGAGGEGGTSSFVTGTGGAGGTGGSGTGGAIYANGTRTALTNTTIAGNAGQGGIGGAGGSPGGAHGVTGAAAGAIFPGGGSVVTNTILAGNSGGNCAVVLGSHDHGHNLEFNPTGSCGFTPGMMGDVLSDPQLGSLSANGGPTATMALGLASAARDAGDDSACAASAYGRDQRGVLRTHGSHCDIGAYEYGFITALSPTIAKPEGGGQMTLLGFGFGSAATVTFDTTAISATGVTPTSINVPVPPHAAGTVDLTIASNGMSVVVRSAFTYGTPAALPTTQPSGGTASIPAALPATRPPATASVPAPNPLPAPRP